jgi:hypothetical protein
LIKSTVLVLALLASSLTFAFDAQRAYDFANELASDKYEGRRSGHPGGIRAEEYVAEYCRGLGLAAMGTTGYFQEVPILVTQEQNATFSIANSELGKISFVQGLDYTLITHSGSSYVNAEAVMIGHGIVSEEKGHDDYGDVDVRGKIVVILRGAPQSAYSFDAENRRSKTLVWAKERGAVAILWYDRSVPLNGAAIPEANYQPDMPMLYVSDRVMNVLLENTGYSLKSYQEKIKSGAAPLETGKQLSLTVATKKLKGKNGRNVIAVKLGSDAVLKNEVVVVGGHLDHCGANFSRVNYNGADDNASGSALVAELARVVAEGAPLKRTVMFVWFTAEEDGLLGSKYFVEHPTVPFGNIVGMLNFDMVGQGDGGSTIVGLELLGDIGKSWADSLAQLEKKPKLYGYDGDASSDYGPFVEAGAPGVAFFSSGSHPFYHHYCDDGKWLNVESFKSVGEQAEALMMTLANRQGSLACRSDSLKMISRFATTIDLDGYFLDPSGTVKSTSSIEVAWLPLNSDVPMMDLVNRMSHFWAYCNSKKIVCSGLKDAVAKQSELKRATVLAIPEISLLSRPTEDVLALTKLGLSLVSLIPTSDAVRRTMPDQLFNTLKDNGVFALIPMDFNTAARVQRWGKQGIVTTSLAQFAQSPEEIRDSLLTSDALLLIDVDAAPTVEQLQTIRAGRQRYVHLNFGESYDDMRDSDQRKAFDVLYQAGYTRDEIFLMTGKNLNRFLNG